MKSQSADKPQIEIINHSCTKSYNHRKVNKPIGQEQKHSWIRE